MRYFSFLPEIALYDEFLAGTPVELIMKISGHRSLKDFYRYIKVTARSGGLSDRENLEGKRASFGRTGGRINIGPA